jgi:hypothetical protein
MDDLEFKKRAYADPNDQTPEFLAAAEVTPERLRLLRQLQALDARVLATAHAIAIPEGLAAKLKAIDANVTRIKPKHSGTKRYFAIAASLVVAFGLALSPSLFSARPSAADLQFHDEVLGHVRNEVARYDLNREDVSFAQINSVLEREAGGHFRENERIKQLHIKFANGCNIASSGRGAHIVLNGTKGSISVMVVHNSPVSTTFDVNDARFTGKIIPFGEGNLIIVGEKDEPLEAYESMIADAFEWSI